MKKQMFTVRVTRKEFNQLPLAVKRRALRRMTREFLAKRGKDKE